MKNGRTMLVVLAALLGLAAAGTLQAAGRKDAEGPGGGKAGWHEKAKKFMQKRLGLTDEQQAKLEKAFEEQRKAAEPLHKELRVGLAKLRWQVEAEADSKDIAATLDQLDAARKSLQAQHDKFVAGLRDILTPAQQAKMLLARMRRGGGPGMRMGMGGPGMEGGFRVHGMHGGPGMPPPPGVEPGMPGPGGERPEGFRDAPADDEGGAPDEDGPEE